MHPLLEEFMYTARGYETGVKLIITCNRERGKREGDSEVWGISYLPRKNSNSVFELLDLPPAFPDISGTAENPPNWLRTY